MIYDMETARPFLMMNIYLKEKDVNLATIMGLMEAYTSAMDDEDIRRFNIWKQRIADYTQNPPEECSAAMLEQLRDVMRQRRLSWMTLVLEEMNGCTELFSGLKPYLFFEESSIEELEQLFNYTIGHEARKVWTEDHRGTDEESDLWTAIVKRVKEVINLETCEIFIYNPMGNEADPVASKYPAISTCYFFFIHRENNKVLAMQFCALSLLAMRRIRAQRAREAAARREGAGGSGGR